MASRCTRLELEYFFYRVLPFFVKLDQLAVSGTLVGRFLFETDSRIFFFISVVRDFFCIFDFQCTTWFIRRLTSFLYISSFHSCKLLVISNLGLTMQESRFVMSQPNELGADVFHGKWNPGALTNWNSRRQFLCRGTAVFPDIIFVLDYRVGESFGALHEACCTGAVTIAIFDGSFFRGDIWFPIPGCASADLRLIYLRLVFLAIFSGRCLRFSFFKSCWGLSIKV